MSKTSKTRSRLASQTMRKFYGKETLRNVVLESSSKNNCVSKEIFNENKNKVHLWSISQLSWHDK